MPTRSAIRNCTPFQWLRRDGLHQDNLGLCTIAAFLYRVLPLKPTQIFQLAQGLFFNGHGVLGKLDVSPWNKALLL
jgi:hypothetical protein